MGDGVSDISSSKPQLRQLLLEVVIQQRDLYNSFVPT
jgi:hypothetical protein